MRKQTIGFTIGKQLRHAQDNNNQELANQISSKIDKIKKIKDSVKDSGITNEEAIYARLHPKMSTAKDIAKSRTEQVLNKQRLEQ